MYMSDDEPVIGSNNPLQMRGLLHVITKCYEKGITLDELEFRIGTAVQKELTSQLQSLDPSSAKIVMDFLMTIDNGLTLNYNKNIVTADVDVITGTRTL